MVGPGASIAISWRLGSRIAQEVLDPELFTAMDAGGAGCSAEYDCDVVILGAGVSGIAAARKLLESSLGLKVREGSRANEVDWAHA